MTDISDLELAQQRLKAAREALDRFDNEVVTKRLDELRACYNDALVRIPVTFPLEEFKVVWCKHNGIWDFRVQSHAGENRLADAARGIRRSFAMTMTVHTLILRAATAYEDALALASAITTIPEVP